MSAPHTCGDRDEQRCQEGLLPSLFKGLDEQPMTIEWCAVARPLSREPLAGGPTAIPSGQNHVQPSHRSTSVPIGPRTSPSAQPKHPHQLQNYRLLAVCSDHCCEPLSAT